MLVHVIYYSLGNFVREEVGRIEKGKEPSKDVNSGKSSISQY